jgi:hypothetical protein
MHSSFGQPESMWAGQHRYRSGVTTLKGKSALRRLLLLAVAGVWLAAASVVMATPASADVPEFWKVPDKVDQLDAILLLGGVPLLLFVVITFLVYAPSVVRGERIAPGHQVPENQWLGGPRKSVGELAGPDTDDSQAGGASGRW